MADWDQQELELIVADYLDMLASELEGKKYRKADHRRNLLPKLNGRTEGSIEFKHQNISAVLRGEGLQWIKGYRPAENFQQALKSVVLDMVGKKDFSIPESSEGFTPIPDEITREHILAAISDFKEGVDHRFGPSSTYDVLHEGERYPPKAIVGLAAAYILGKPLQPEDFGGGLETKCFRLLESNGFKIVRKTDNAEPPMTREQATDRLANIVGDSSGKAEVNTRKEQKILQDYLIQSRTEAICHLCGKEFPVTFLVAAHIKKRADCTDGERKNLDVGMLACKFGCDDLYEKKYIFVDEKGIIRRNQSKSITKAMEPTIVSLDGKECSIWSDSNKEFFDAHRTSDQ
jgi:hypothetical protein